MAHRELHRQQPPQLRCLYEVRHRRGSHVRDLRSGRSKACPQDARYANCVGGGHDHIEDPFNKQFTAVGNGRKAEAEYDEKCSQRDYVDRR